MSGKEAVSDRADLRSYLQLSPRTPPPRAPDRAPETCLESRQVTVPAAPRTRTLFPPLFHLTPSPVLLMYNPLSRRGI